MTVAASLISLSLSGCTLVITTGIFSDVSSTHGVQIVAAVAARGATMDTVTARVTNTGARAIFVPRCGRAPLLLAQQFVNGAWLDDDNAACPSGDALNPIELDPGVTIVSVKIFTSRGRFRLVMTVGESEDFHNSAQTTSNAFALP